MKRCALALSMVLVPVAVAAPACERAVAEPIFVIKTTDEAS